MLVKLNIRYLSFRKKIFFSQLILFFLFLAFLFPFVEKVVTKIARSSLEERIRELIPAISSLRSERELVRYLQRKEEIAFFRIGLLNDRGELIFDSHLVKLLKDNFTPYFPTAHVEVLQALKTGVGYSERFSQLFGQKFIYVALSFPFNEKEYVLRGAFPYSHVNELIHHFEFGFLGLGIFLLLFFSAITWLIFYRLSRPIQRIIQAVKPYEEGKEGAIARINLGKLADENDDFYKLAKTLNSLSEKVQHQIKSAIEERNEKEAILESLGEGVIAVDGMMRISYINFMGSKMLGIPKKQLLGKPFPKETSPFLLPLLEKCCELLTQCQKDLHTATDSLFLGQAHKFYLELIAAPKARGSGAILVLQDKSSDYRMIEMGKKFVENASHELKTPITIVRGFAETLHDLPRLSKKLIAEITEKIVRNCSRMENLVKHLLTLADIENLPQTRFRECDLVALLENCIHMILSIYPEASIKMVKEKEIILAPVDPDLLELSIINLLENSVKYSSSPATITVEVSWLEEEVKIAVQDQGIGIPEADIEHIFERFYTVDKARSRRMGGAGLGLSIVKTIVEKHNGTIGVNSKEGEGSCFTLFLPSKKNFEIHSIKNS